MTLKEWNHPAARSPEPKLRSYTCVVPFYTSVPTLIYLRRSALILPFQRSYTCAVPFLYFRSNVHILAPFRPSSSVLSPTRPGIRPQGTKKNGAPGHLCLGALLKDGGDLLSRLRSTIGAAVLNCSVRNGKRWNHSAIATKSVRVTH